MAAAALAALALMALFELLSLRRPHKQQGCQVFCPGCGIDLTKSTTLREAGYTEDGSLFQYLCACGVRSRWDFDPPVPIFMGKEESDG